VCRKGAIIAALFNELGCHQPPETLYAESLPCIRRRGNIFSRAHIALSPSEAAFWDFSWDEMAAGDLPALTDYVLAATGHRKLGYVGGQLRLMCVF
jgi:hypothetical protein